MRSLVIGLLLVLGLVSCSSESNDDEITVFAAASLTDVFTDLAREFEDLKPGTEVTLVFAGSSALAAQILDGAPADVFAAADTQTMDRVPISDPTVFATNSLAIAVPVGNPADVRTVADLGRPATKVAICQEQVPCGAAAETVLNRAGLDVTPVTLESDVRAVLTKVRLNEVDAGLVYRTDIASADDQVDSIAINDADNVIVEYPIAQIRDGDLAAEFVAFVLSDRGRDVLAAAGFGLP